MNRNKWKITGVTVAAVATLLLLAATLSSCTKELTEDESSLPDGAVRIVLSVGDTNGEAKSNSKTRAPENGTDDENRIANIKVLLYGHDSQTLEFIKGIDDVNSQTDSDIKWDKNTITIKGVTDQTKAYDIYVVANWTDRFNTGDFEKGSSIDNLTNAFTQISSQIANPDAAHPLLMSGVAEGHVFNKNLTATVALVRQVAKLRIKVKIDKKFQDAHPDAVFGAKASPDNNQLTVYNVPNSSYVCGPVNQIRYDVLMAKEGNPLFNYPAITVTGTDATVVVDATVYVYENITMGTTAKEKATFMMLRLPYKLDKKAAESTIMTDNYYKFYVQDKDNLDNPHKTLRNHIYDLTVTIVGFGGLKPDDAREAYAATTVAVH